MECQQRPRVGGDTTDNSTSAWEEVELGALCRCLLLSESLLWWRLRKQNTKRLPEGANTFSRETAAGCTSTTTARTKQGVEQKPKSCCLTERFVLVIPRITTQSQTVGRTPRGRATGRLRGWLLRSAHRGAHEKLPRGSRRVHHLSAAPSQVCTWHAHAREAGCLSQNASACTVTWG